MNKTTLARRKLTGRMGIQKLVEKRRPTLLGIKRLMLEIESLVKKVELDKGSIDQQRKKLRFMKKMYGARTGEELANRRRILVAAKNGEKIAGCHQESLVLYNALKELEEKTNIKLNPKMINQFITKGVQHTAVIFEYKGELYEADPYYGQLHKLDEFKKEGLQKGIIKIAEPKPMSYAEYRQQKRSGKLIGE